MRQSRPNLTKQLMRLEKKHETLKARVREMEERCWISPEEQVACNQLKKQKLAAKDAMEVLRTVQC